jgi:putative transposase
VKLLRYVPVKFLIRDRGSNFTEAFDAVLPGAGIRTVLCNVRTPRMNAIMERWIGAARRELLNRTLIWNHEHRDRILHGYEATHEGSVVSESKHRSLNSEKGTSPLNINRLAILNQVSSLRIQ